MQKRPMPASVAVQANAAHHHFGARISTAAEMRSVTQAKLRRLSTSGTRASGRSTEVEASSAITSGAVVAPSILINVILSRGGGEGSLDECSRHDRRAANEK